MPKLVKSRKKCNMETARRSDRLKTKVPPIVSPQKSVLMRPVPLPLVKLEVKSEPMDEESTSLCCSPVPESRLSTPDGPFVTARTCYLCPALLVYNETTGVAYHLGDNGCIFASNNPTNFSEAECKSSNTTENAPIEKVQQPLISSYSPAKPISKEINTATRTPKINLGDKKRRASASPSREPENRKTKKIPRVDSPTSDDSRLHRPMKFGSTPNKISSNPSKKPKLLHPWTCRVCQTSYWKQRDYMYHSCGFVPKALIKRPLDVKPQKWTKRWFKN